MAIDKNPQLMMAVYAGVGGLIGALLGALIWCYWLHAFCHCAA
jgi:hypothetical protein